jgi:DNA polymerase III subunit epsilon
MGPSDARVFPSIDCVAVDFETATGQRRSACALGVVVVCNGQVIDAKKWLFQPHGGYFEARNSRIHGISAQAVADRPRLDDLWGEIRPFFDNRHIIAHYAQFDISVLRHSLNAIGVSCPTFEYTCTWLVAKSVWPAYRTYSLPYLAGRLRLDIDHHDALADARTCWAILLAACQKRQATSIGQLEEDVRLVRGRFSHQRHVRPSRCETASIVCGDLK